MGTYGSTWQARGYCGGGNVESLIGTEQNRPAVVCGNAQGVFEDYDRIMSKFPTYPVVFAVNDVGMYLPRVDHWVSLHGHKFDGWSTVRRQTGRDTPKTHSIDEKFGLDYHWAFLNPLFALSGYFAMQIAWIMACSPIVLIGCPGNPQRRFFDAQIRTDFGYGGGEQSQDRVVREQLISEMNRVPVFKRAVRSQRGWTREFFGCLLPQQLSPTTGGV